MSSAVVVTEQLFSLMKEVKSRIRMCPTDEHFGFMYVTKAVTNLAMKDYSSKSCVKIYLMTNFVTQYY